MKKIMLSIIFCFFTVLLSAQFIYKIKADSLLIANDTCTTEMILQNSTKNVAGFLYNKGNGRTEFRRGAIKLNDSTYLIGSDTIKTGGSSTGNYILNQSISDQSASFRIAGNGLFKGGISSTFNTGLRNERFGLGAMNSFSTTATDNTALGYNSLNLLNNASSSFNTALGSYALEKMNTIAPGNTAVGYESMREYIGTVGANTAVGSQALKGGAGSFTGYYNSAFGYNTLSAITTGNYNYAFGFGVGSSLTTGVNNTIFGTDPVSAAGSYNVSIGTNALVGSGSRSVVIGQQAGSANLTGTNFNVLIGMTAGNGLTSSATNMVILGNAGGTNYTSSILVGQSAGGGNSAYSSSGSIWMGFVAGQNIKQSTANVVLGERACYTDTVVTNSTVMGYYALNGSQNVSNSVVLGGNAYRNINTLSNSVAVGYQAGYNVIGGSSSGNVFLGYQAGYNETGSNKLYIDNSNTSTPLVYGDFANDTLRVNGKFHANGPVKIDLGSDATGDIFYRNSSGQFTRLPIGTSGQVLTVNSGLPSWTTDKFKATATLDFPNTGSLSSSTLNVTVTGASVGDQVLVTKADGTSPSGELYTGAVSAANTVTIKFQNVSGSAINPSSTNYNITVVKF